METYSHYFTLLDPNSPQWDAAWKQLILTDIPRILSYADIKLQDPSYSYYQDYYYYDHQILDPNDYPQDDNNDTEENYDDDDDDDHDDHDDTDYGLDSPAPIIDLEEGIHLNGVGKDGHESLCMEKYDAGHSFVTTAGKPYDLVVCLIYLRAYMLASGCVEVESDGTWGWSWHYVRVAYELLWPREEVRCPWGDDE